MDKIRHFFKEYSDELIYKVQWPSLQDLQESTVAVFIASLIFALVIALMDFIFQNGLEILYSLF